LNKRRFFLLIDGINELPSDEAENEIRRFRKTYPQVPMVFTTRELGLRGNLGIEKQLTVQPLTETQMKDFVRGYLGNDELIKQLRNERLRKLGETPLLLWMLCSIYSKCGRVPDNLGETFREFTGAYDNKLKADVTTRAGSKDLWADSLQYLAFRMTVRKDEPVIGVREAEGIIDDFLRENREKDDSLSRCRQWLDDLIRLHLLQKRNEDSIEFHHQLIQEYYAAEYLLQQLKGLSDRDLQWRYLNYLKWTEPIALMLGLLKDRELALKVVRLALAVYFGLGVRLAVEVNPLWQEETVKWVAELPVSMQYRVYLLGKIGSENAVEPLITALGDQDWRVRNRAADALGNIGSERAVEPLITALGDENRGVHEIAVWALGNIGSEKATEALIAVLGHGNWSVYMRKSAVEALGKIGSERAIEPLITALGDENRGVRESAVEALGNIASERAVEPLIDILEHGNWSVYMRNRAVKPLIDVLEHRNWSVMRYRAAAALGNIGSEKAVEPLITALGDEDRGVRYSALEALRKIGSKRALEALIATLEDEEQSLIAALSR
jgi:HEAT repeat protein